MHQGIFLEEPHSTRQPERINTIYNNSLFTVGKEGFEPVVDLPSEAKSPDLPS